MPRTSFGITGKDICMGDKTCAIKKISGDQILIHVEKEIIKIPEFQRELELDKVNSIKRKFIEKHKKGENYLIKHGYTMSLCKIADRKELWVIDGQHRLEVIKILVNEGYRFDVQIRIQLCETLEDMKDDFKLINANSNIALSYTYFENQFIQNSIIQVKNILKKEYNKAFSRYKKKSKRSNKIHINSFIELLDIDQIRKLYDDDKKDYGNYLYLYRKLLGINKEIKDHFKENNKISYYINKIDSKMTDETKFYLSLDNIKWIEALFNEDEIEYKSINYKKKSIPKKLRIQVLNRDIGEKEFIGKCYVCKEEISRENCEIGHIIAEHDNGKTNLSNLKAICFGCNRSMGTQNMEKYKQEYYN